MAMANLVNPSEIEEADGLDEQEIQVLVEAGIVSAKSKRGLRRRKPRHVVFVQSQEQGPSQESSASLNPTRMTAQKYTQPNGGVDSPKPEEPRLAPNLGWKTETIKSSRQTKTKAPEDREKVRSILLNADFTKWQYEFGRTSPGDAVLFCTRALLAFEAIALWVGRLSARVPFLTPGSVTACVWR